MSQNPKISIIICTRNRGERLAGTLRSLSNIKTDLEWEVILADNASTDNTREVILEHSQNDNRCKYLHVKAIGLGAARDAAWRAARGNIMSFTDDDCYLEPDYIDAINAVFNEFPNVGGVGGRIMLYDPGDARVTIDERDTPSQIAPKAFVKAGTFHGANLSFRREALEAIDGFDVNLGAGTPYPAEDVDAYARVLQAGYSMRFDPRPVVYHHHGRKAEDVPALRASYDKGRGAYYAKFIHNRETRSTYARNWWQKVKQVKSRDDIRQISRELNSGVGYLIAAGHWTSILFFGSLGLFFLIFAYFRLICLKLTSSKS